MALEAAAKYLQKPLAEGADGPTGIYLLVELLRDGHPSVVKARDNACFYTLNLFSLRKQARIEYCT